MWVVSGVRTPFPEKNGFCIFQSCLLTCTDFQYFVFYLDTATQSQMKYLTYHCTYFLEVGKEEGGVPIGFPTQNMTLKICGSNDLIDG